MDTMKSFHIKPSIDFLNILLRRRLFSREYKNADVVFKLIQENQLTPNIMTFGCLALKVRNVKTFEEFVNDLKAIGFALNKHMISTIYRKAGADLNSLLVKKLFDTIIEDKIRVDAKYIDSINKNIEITKEKIIEFVSI